MMGYPPGVCVQTGDDDLTQITAASNALKKVAVGLLEDHIRHCVADATEPDVDMVAEASAAIGRLVKS